MTTVTWIYKEVVAQDERGKNIGFIRFLDEQGGGRYQGTLADGSSLGFFRSFEEAVSTFEEKVARHATRS